MKHHSGRPLELSDFLPWPREEEPEATLEDIAKLLTGASKRSK